MMKSNILSNNGDVWSIISSFSTLKGLVNIFSLSKQIYKICDSNFSWKERTYREFCSSQISGWIKTNNFPSLGISPNSYKTIYRIFRAEIVGKYQICGQHDDSSDFYSYNVDIDKRKIIRTGDSSVKKLLRQSDDPTITIFPRMIHASGHCWAEVSGSKAILNDTYVLRLGKFISFFQNWSPNQSTVSLGEHVVTENGEHTCRGIFCDNLKQEGTFLMLKLDKKIPVEASKKEHIPKEDVNEEYLQKLIVVHLLSQPKLRMGDTFFSDCKKEQTFSVTLSPLQQSKNNEEHKTCQLEEELITTTKKVMVIRKREIRMGMFTCEFSSDRGIGQGEGYFYSQKKKERNKINENDDDESEEVVLEKEGEFKVYVVYFNGYYAIGFYRSHNGGESIELCSLCRLKNNDDGLEGVTFSHESRILDTIRIVKK